MSKDANYKESTTPPPGYDPQYEQRLDFKIADQFEEARDRDQKNFFLTTVDEIRSVTCSPG